VQQNGDKEVVDKKAFRQFGIVVAKEEHCEDNDKKLMWRICESIAKHLDTAHDYDECRNATSTPTTQHGLLQNSNNIIILTLTVKLSFLHFMMYNKSITKN